MTRNPNALFGVLQRAADAVRVVRRAVVEGDSMRPAFEPGDRLLIARGRVRAGDVVAARDPRAPERILIKRVTLIDRREVVLHGDNAGASTDSRTFGAVPRHLVLGRAVHRYAPPDRAGRLTGGGPRRR